MNMKSLCAFTLIVLASATPGHSSGKSVVAVIAQTLPSFVEQVHGKNASCPGWVDQEVLSRTSQEVLKQVPGSSFRENGPSQDYILSSQTCPELIRKLAEAFVVAQPR